MKAIEFAPTSSTGRNGDPVSRAEARHRGVLIHRLLQELPRLDASVRQARAKQYLDRFAAELSDSTRTAIIAEALKVIGYPRLAQLFGPESRAEVSMLGKWNENGKPFEDFGRVDRLAVTATEVWIADFKSDAVPPADSAHTPKVYLEQLARYRAVLSRLYPGKAMHALIIWTANGAIHEIPDSLLDSAFSRLTAA